MDFRLPPNSSIIRNGFGRRRQDTPIMNIIYYFNNY